MVAGALVMLLVTAVLALAVVAPAGAKSPPTKPAAAGYNLYFGDLHAHTSYSDGVNGTTPWDAFPVGHDAGADFMALTEHYSATNTYEAWTMDEAEWPDLKAAAAYFTSSSFVAIPAYEFYLAAHSGEFNVFNVPDLPPKMEITGPDRLGLFFDWLAQQPGGVAQFNHPTYVTDEFNDFAGFSAARDAGMGMIEVYNDEFYEASFIKALDAGWHVMPSANSDTHKADWIWGRDMRTVLLAESLTAGRPLRGHAGPEGLRDPGQEPEHPLQRERQRDGLHPVGHGFGVHGRREDLGSGRPRGTRARRRHARGDRLRRGAVVRSLKPSACRRDQDHHLDGEGAAGQGTLLLGAREHGLRRRQRSAGRHGLDRAGLDGSLAAAHGDVVDRRAQDDSNGPMPETVTIVVSSDGGLTRATAASP